MEPAQPTAKPGWGAKLTVAFVFTAITVAVVYPLWRGRPGTRNDAQQPVQGPIDPPDPVLANRGADILDGFRGTVHPLLHGQTRLEVGANWSPIGQGNEQLERLIPHTVYGLFLELKPAISRRVYTERDFSCLMPETVGSVGQVWEIGGDRVAEFLRQFHPQVSLHVEASGRRAGPDGAFAVLRAVSPTHLDILLRIHAEFEIAEHVWVTPACFWGRMIVDKQAGTVEYFRIWVPTENPLNLHLTVAESIKKGQTKSSAFHMLEEGDVLNSMRDIVRVEQMELASDRTESPETLEWAETIELDAARRRLKTAFFAFENINWVSWEAAPQKAREQHKPILAIVLWGALDDQSC